VYPGKVPVRWGVSAAGNGTEATGRRDVTAWLTLCERWPQFCFEQ